MSERPVASLNIEESSNQARVLLSYRTKILFSTQLNKMNNLKVKAAPTFQDIQNILRTGTQ